MQEKTAVPVHCTTVIFVNNIMYVQLYSSARAAIGEAAPKLRFA
eukprot:SAG31_NODE_1951_length_6831_cov_2.867053_2_plen_44_part_00